MHNNYKAKQIPATTITGSIKGYWANATTTISDCVMGEFHQDHLTTADITIAANNYLDGPFIAANVSAGTGIVYYNGTLL